MLTNVALRITALNVVVFSLVVAVLLATVFFAAERAVNANADDDLRGQVESFRPAGSFDAQFIPGDFTSTLALPIAQTYTLSTSSLLFDQGVAVDGSAFGRPIVIGTEPLTVTLQGAEVPVEADPKSFIYVSDTTSQVSASTAGNTASPVVEEDVSAALAGEIVFSTVAIDGEAFRVVSGPVGFGSTITGAVQIGQSREVQDEVIGTLRNVLLSAGALSLAVSGIAGYFLASRTLRPVQQAMHRQKTFIADASHELRTPVTIIRSHAEELEEMVGGPDVRDVSTQHRLARELREETESLSESIDGLLDLARLDSPNGHSSIKAADAVEVVESTIESMQPVAAGRSTTIESSGTETAAGSISDPTALRSVLAELLENAIKYGREAGTVMVGVTANASTVEIRVSDDGPGIAPEHLDRVFERFYRADPARSHEIPGAGLGLSIARETAEAMGGRLTISSELGQGTTAVLHLPLVPPQPPKP